MPKPATLQVGLPVGPACSSPPGLKATTAPFCGSTTPSILFDRPRPTEAGRGDRILVDLSSLRSLPEGRPLSPTIFNQARPAALGIWAGLPLRASDTWPIAHHVPGVTPFKGVRGTGLRPKSSSSVAASLRPLRDSARLPQPAAKSGEPRLRALCSKTGCSRNFARPASALSTDRTALSQNHRERSVRRVCALSRRSARLPRCPALGGATAL